MVLDHNLKHRLQVYQMIIQRAVVNQDVVKKDKDEASEKGSYVHKPFKGGWGIGEAEGHDEELIMSLMSPEGRLGNVGWVHQDLVIPRAQVQFGEDHCPMEFVKQFINDRNWKFVFDCIVVKSSIVNTKSSTTIRLADQKDWGRKWALTWANDA